MKSLRDEIRLRREIRTDLISSAKQISTEQSEDFIAVGDFMEHPNNLCANYLDFLRD